jgi:hypothetical protein
MTFIGFDSLVGVERGNSSSGCGGHNWGVFLPGGAVAADGAAYAAKVSGFRFQVHESPKSEVRGPESGAEECFNKVIEIARRQSAKSLELRVVTSLSRLWQQQGKKEESHDLLSEIYNWFTEGFDTKDLQEAKALLEELA